MLKGASWSFIARFFIPWNFRFFIPWNFKHVSSKTHENISKWQSSQRGETKHNRAFLKKGDQGTGSLWWNASSDEDDDDNSSNKHGHGDDHDEENAGWMIRIVVWLWKVQSPADDPIKGTVSRDFSLQILCVNHLPPSPWK
jgi:hypothetical protein